MLSMKTLLLVFCLLGVAASALAQARDGVPLMLPPLGAAKAASATSPRPLPPPGPVVAGHRTIGWEALVPADWDPFKDFKGIDFALLDDGDPRANRMLQQMREAWDKAPTNPALIGQPVRIPGFVVPLEETKDGLKEFLLVPYFGACVHSPPPPANQIIHVLPRSPAKGVRSMDAVWISGVLKSDRTESYMGSSGYRIEAVTVMPYTDRGR